MPPAPTHYQTLGLPPTASPEQIRRAYRSHAKALHPDVNPSKDSARAFARIAAAYEILSDPEKRRDYDRILAARAARQNRPPDRSASDLRQGHYAWVNVAARPSDSDRDISEIDELYDTFFKQSGRKRHPTTGAAPSPKPPNGHTQGKPKRPRKRSI